MKKYLSLIAVVVLCVLGTIHAQSDVKFVPKFGLNLAGNHEVEWRGQSGDVDVNIGVDLGLDIVTDINENVTLGGGLGYYIPRSQDVSGSGNFSFLPIYGLAKFYFLGQEQFDVGLGGQLGYNFYSGNDKYSGNADLNGGLYFAIGAHCRINNRLIIEAYYKSSTGDVADVFDVNYTTFTLQAGLLL